MAQAPDAGGVGAPRQNKTVKQLQGMNTQNQREAVPEGQFAWLENIQPIGPGNLHSIPGRASAVVRIPPNNQCPETEPGAQALPTVCCYDSNGFGDLTGNDNGMFAHADDDGNFWHCPTLNSGFGSGPYPVATPSRTWYLLQPTSPGDTSSPPDCSLTDVTVAQAVALPGGMTADFQSTQTPQGGTCGKSDERCYRLNLANVTPNVSVPLLGSFANVDAYFGETSGVTFTVNNGGPHGGGVANSQFGNAWCKFDDHLYAVVVSGFAGAKQVMSWPIVGGRRGRFWPRETVYDLADRRPSERHVARGRSCRFNRISRLERCYLRPGDRGLDDSRDRLVRVFAYRRNVYRCLAANRANQT